MKRGCAALLNNPMNTINSINPTNAVPLEPYKDIPENSINPMAIRPVTIIVIPNPCRSFGTSAYRSLIRIAAMEAIARSHPVPDPIPKTRDSINE